MAEKLLHSVKIWLKNSPQPFTEAWPQAGNYQQRLSPPTTKFVDNCKYRSTFLKAAKKLIFDNKYSNSFSLWFICCDFNLEKCLLTKTMAYKPFFASSVPQFSLSKWLRHSLFLKFEIKFELFLKELGQIEIFSLNGYPHCVPLINAPNIPHLTYKVKT